ncbi:hypothetical protein B0T14DRAFT_14895 [Immersiella caudata]|uniref:Uncharacterized protein n=1 Tax=Immersiella caudata TaxID=314043 RepID=A0AA39XDV5_9PEZI|nr:hypothetical protein B0T14DRAFT_14895 [Immersiella caudata]
MEVAIDPYERHSSREEPLPTAVHRWRFPSRLRDSIFSYAFSTHHSPVDEVMRLAGDLFTEHTILFLSIARCPSPAKVHFLLRRAACQHSSPRHQQRSAHQHVARQRSGTPVYLALRTSLWEAENSCRRSKVTFASIPAPSQGPSSGETQPHAHHSFSNATLPVAFGRPGHSLPFFPEDLSSASPFEKSCFCTRFRLGCYHLLTIAITSTLAAVERVSKLDIMRW